MRIRRRIRVRGGDVVEEGEELPVEEDKDENVS